MAALRPIDPALGAKGRHPSAGPAGVVLAGAVRPVADALARIGAEHPAVAAATIAVRGAQGRGREAFAVAYGLALATVEALEAGALPSSQVPAPLLHLTPLRAIEARLAVGPSAVGPLVPGVAVRSAGPTRRPVDKGTT